MQASATAPLLLVGFQRDVRPALRVLARPVHVLVARGRRVPDVPELAGVREIDLHGPTQPIADEARDLLAGERPAAIVAMAERTVLVAARLRQTFGLPGNDAEVALRCADKLEMKRAMGAGGVPVAPWRELRRDSDASELIEALGLPIVVKPRRDSGGRGQRRFDDQRSLAQALEQLAGEGAFENGYGWLAEGWLDGVEMSIEAFVHSGLPRFQNPTEYYVSKHANILPAQLDAAQWRALREFDARALAAAGVERGVTHLELFRTPAGPIFGELAIRPPGGRLMALLRSAWGFDPWEALLRLELGEIVGFPTAPRRVAGVWILHPGNGHVRAIRGLEDVRALPHVRRVALKVRQGESIAERQGTGQDVGALYADGPDRDTVAAALTRAHRRLQIELS